MADVQDCGDVVARAGVPVGREAAFENAGWLAGVAVSIAKSELFWGCGLVVERPDFEAEFGGEEGEGVENGWGGGGESGLVGVLGETIGVGRDIARELHYEN